MRFHSYLRKTSNEEKSALEKLYKELNGNLWLNNNNWLVADPCEVNSLK